MVYSYLCPSPFTEWNHVTTCCSLCCYLQIFIDIWRHKELHPQLLKLLGMWDGIFPKQPLDRMHQAVKQSSPAQMSGRQNIPPMQYPAQAQPVQQHSGQWRPTPGAPPLQAVAPYVTHGASTSGSGPYTAVQQPVYTTRKSTPPASVQYVGPSNSYNYAHPGSRGGHAQAAWQQQPPLVQQSHYPPAQVQQSSQPMVLPSLLTSLLSSGLLSVQQPVSFAPALSTAPVVSYTHPPSRAGTPEPINPEDCKFVPSKLKVLSWLLSSVMHVCILVLTEMYHLLCGMCMLLLKLWQTVISVVCLHLVCIMAFDFILNLACALACTLYIKSVCLRPHERPLLELKFVSRPACNAQ